MPDLTTKAKRDLIAYLTPGVIRVLRQGLRAMRAGEDPSDGPPRYWKAAWTALDAADRTRRPIKEE